MKKIMILLAAAFCMSINTYAKQQPLEPSKITDNVSLGFTVGDITKLNSPFNNNGFELGVNLTKMITPTFGIQVEGVWSTDDDTTDPVFFQHQYVGVNTVTNLYNLFGSYKGHTRRFDIDMILGIGWGHLYKHNSSDNNFAESKIGLSFNVNLGSKYQHTISFKPYVTYCLDKDLYEANYNINRGYLHLAVGYTYHFKTSNGTHGFVFTDKLYTQQDVDELNNNINELRAQNKELANRPPVVKEVEKTVEVKKPVYVNSEYVCTFGIGKSILSKLEKDRLRRFADNLPNDATVKVTGSADTDTGSRERNIQLANERAEVVANYLKSRGINVEVTEPILDIDKGVEASRAALTVIQ